MEIIEYFSSEDKEHWLSEIGKSDWGAGHFLKKLLETGKTGTIDGFISKKSGKPFSAVLKLDGDKVVFDF